MIHSQNFQYTVYSVVGTLGFTKIKNLPQNKMLSWNHFRCIRLLYQALSWALLTYFFFKNSTK